MSALGLLACVPVVMWIVQSVALRAAGLPIRHRIDSRGAPASVRNAGRVATQLSLVAVILLFPVMRSNGILPYYGEFLPLDETVRHFAQGAAASILCLCVLYLAWIVSSRIRVELHQSRRKWIKRLVLLVPTALLGALVEEIIFRGIVMADLLHSGVQPRLAMVLAALVFAGAHYVRAVKRRWTFPGHILLGIVLCLAFAATGTLWLAVGLHAGGILMIMGTRPFFRFDGPAWLTGASIFPFAGITGIAGLVVLASWVARYYPA